MLAIDRLLNTAPTFHSLELMTGPMMDNRMRPLTAHLGSLDAGHVLFGQAGAVQGLLGVVSVALEHLRL